MHRTDAGGESGRSRGLRGELYVRWAAALVSVVCVVGGCAVGETPPPSGDVGSDATDVGVDTEVPVDVAMDVDGPEVGRDADRDIGEDVETDTDESGECNGCGAGETCHNGRCQDICLQAGASCGEATWQGATAMCGQCGTGAFCRDGSCADICQTTGASCGQVWWGGTSASCGSCGSGRCVGNRCVVSGGYRNIAGGYRHSCAVLASGSVECWGVNGEGQLGHGSDSVGRETSPVSVSSVRSAVDVDSSYNHTCVLTTSGAAFCWGANDEGQLGDGSTGGFSGTPQQVSGLSNATSVGVGKLHTCAVSGGGGSCWGKGSLGRLGTGQSMSGTFPTPQSVANLNGMLRVESGVRHSCALTSDGSVWCWGARGQGRLGDGQLLGSTSTPVQVSDVEDATSLAVGSVHACVVDQRGQVRCWGDGGGGRLGYGGTSLKVVPVDVSMPSGVTAVEVVAGSRMTCMRTAGDSVYCWGEVLTQQNGYQSFGDTPSKMNVSGTPVALAAGRDHVCALFADGSARCWGNNSEGQLGNGTTDDSLSPVQVQ